jgi:hypothetical protein
MTKLAGTKFTLGQDFRITDRLTIELSQSATGSVSVLDYGAKGDGVTDDTAAIQAAINSASANYEIVFPASSGKYVFTNVNLSNKINLRISGSGVLGGSLTISQSQFIQISGVTFNLGRPTIGGTTFAISLERSSSIKIHDVVFRGMDRCIYVAVYNAFQHVNRVAIVNCSTEIADSSLYTSGEINNGSFPSVYYSEGFPGYFLYIDNPSQSAPSIDVVGDVSVTACNPVLCSVGHIYGFGVDGAVIQGNVFFFTAGFYRSQYKNHNIYFKRCTGILINGNQLFEAGRQGIYLDGVATLNITGNSIVWPGQRDFANGQGIYIAPLASDPVTNAVICGNNIRIPTGDGIELAADCTFATITGNTVITPGNDTRYYGNGTAPQGPSAVPAITGTKVGIRVAASCYQVAVVGNCNMLAYNALPKSTSTAYSAAVYAGPIDVGNNTTAGYDKPVATLTLTTIASNTIAIDGAQRVVLNLGGAETLSTIDGGNNGQSLVLYNGSTDATITHGSTIKLSGGVNATLAYEKSITLQNVAGVWYEISRTP